LVLPKAGGYYDLIENGCAEEIKKFEVGEMGIDLRIY